jgi:hypothetical protein
LALNGGKEELALLEDEESELFPPQAVRMIKIDMNNGNNDFFIFLLYKIFRKINAAFTPEKVRNTL